MYAQSLAPLCILTRKSRNKRSELSGTKVGIFHPVMYRVHSHFILGRKDCMYVSDCGKPGKQREMPSMQAYRTEQIGHRAKQTLEGT